MEIEVLLELIELILTRKDGVEAFSEAILKRNFCFPYFDYLLSEGFLPDGEALLAATKMRQIEAVRFVLKSGVKPTLESFQYAAEHEFFELCHLFVEFGSREILSTPELERQLNEAINNDRRRTAIKLINQGVDFTTQDNHAIRMASEFGRIAVVYLLLKHGVDFTTDDNYAIKLASEWGHTEVVRLLLENDSEYKVDPKAEDNYAIRLASEGGHLEVVRLLLKHGADPTDRDNDAIQWASEWGHTEVVRLLLDNKSKYKVDPTANDNYAIKWASQMGHLEIIALLEQYGASF